METKAARNGISIKTLSLVDPVLCSIQRVDAVPDRGRELSGGDRPKTEKKLSIKTRPPHDQRLSRLLPIIVRIICNNDDRSAMDLDGIIYAPTTDITLAGGNSVDSSSIVIISDKVTFQGGSTFLGDFDTSSILNNALLLQAKLVE